MKHTLIALALLATFSAKAQTTKDTVITVTYTKQAWALHNYIVNKTSAEFNLVQDYMKYLGQAAQVIPPTLDSANIKKSHK